MNIENILIKNKKITKLDTQTRLILVQIMYMYDIMLIEYNYKKSSSEVVNNVFKLIKNCIEDESLDSKDNNNFKEVIHFFEKPETFNDEDNEENLYGYNGVLYKTLKKHELNADYISFIIEITNKILYCKNHIDDIIQENLEGKWGLKDIAYVIRAILRLAIFEIKQLNQLNKSTTDKINDIFNSKADSENISSESDEQKKNNNKIIRSYIKLTNILSHSKDIAFIHAFMRKTFLY
ncbi:transcription antitermination factor NusB [Lyticum sinuosum]|uniref:NusB/RsmB/TIM44 domain-containing protein n=1 Tax=Lyticum sinuosum TaxID=1332059 RepID=A0AAE4VMD1_9RICK|nr:transcription antitermination factor NusB [Lyticum sinuosum]MDZ5761473.1 hypothetical protein [Lyticum sinuosum]